VLAAAAAASRLMIALLMTSLLMPLCHQCAYC